MWVTLEYGNLFWCLVLRQELLLAALIKDFTALSLFYFCGTSSARCRLWCCCFRARVACRADTYSIGREAGLIREGYLCEEVVPRLFRDGSTHNVTRF